MLDAGLTLTRLAEHDEVDWPAYPWMVEDRPTATGALSGRRAHLVPLEYTLEATATMPGSNRPGGGGISRVAIILRFSGRRHSAGTAHPALINRGPRRPCKQLRQGTARHNRTNAPPGIAPCGAFA